MPPSRRKGANKAAAAAAARRKLKVGDLVLAKVKGFPAWPATVSEPEKWGYPADMKKVVVFFFGTQQIAFCSPADIEEFTEEKKVSLLGKRHGKGADFVRAVKEISDCFEKLKKQEDASIANDAEETNITNENNSVESSTKHVKTEAHVINVLSTAATNDQNSLTENVAAATVKDAFHDEEKCMGGPSSSVFLEAPIPTTYLTRSKIDISQPRNTGSQWRKFSRSLRSSSRIDASKLQNIMPTPLNTTRNSRRMGANALQARSLRRSKRIMKSSDDPEGRGANSLALVSSDSTEETDSENMTLDSDMLNVNDGSTIDSGSKPMESERSSENNVGGTELSDNLDFQTTTFVKKRWKPDPKRDNNNAVGTAKVIASDAEVIKCECIPPSFNEKLARRNAEDDGDEHLPFAKRARVRMGGPILTAKEITSANKEEEMLEVPENLAVQPSEPLSCKMDVLDDQKFASIEENLPNSSLSHASPAKNPQFWETGKNFADGEAALPPSKRLHRALEAMCANAVEDCQGVFKFSTSVDIQRNGSCPFSESSELSMGKKAIIELKPGAVKDQSDGDSQSSASEFCIMSNMEMSENDAKNNVTASACGKSSCMDSTNIELYKDALEHEEWADAKRRQLSPHEVPAKIFTEHDVKLDSFYVSEHLAQLDSCAPGLTVNLTVHCKAECSELNEALKASDLNISPVNSNSVFDEDVAVGLPNIGKGIQPDGADGEGGEICMTEHLSLAENNQDTKRSELVEEAGPASLGSNILPSVTSAKVLTGGHHQYLVHSNSVTCDHADDRTVSVTQSSSSLTDGPDSVARASPPSSSVCNLSTSDNTNNTFENNSSCSPDVHLHLEKAKLAGKSSSKWESLSSFEAAIKSLTRTKESIGRATRIAIDCAKFGLATKVVQILVHNLESESSLHKKVDLFFLVDSITQCSRGVKGDGGIYPSAIQALLPRLLLAAAPPGSSSHENHRQCLKVLRVWQERKILPEPIIRHHIRQLDAFCGSYPTISSRRPLRNERAFDDPIREMEGMLVDEYGSNSSIQLPGFCMPPMLRGDDGGSESDGENFEAVTPERNVENFDGEKSQIHVADKRSHILEDVDGELEMEDVAPCCEIEGNNIVGADHMQVPHHQSDCQYGAPFTTQPPKDVLLAAAPLSMPALPRPPPPPSQPPSVSLPTVINSVSNGHDLTPHSSSQNFYSKLHGSFPNRPVLPSVNPTPADAVLHCVHGNKGFEAQVPRQMADSNNASFSSQPSSHLPAQTSNSVHPTDALSKGFHVRPPHPAPSNQFSYVQEPRTQPCRDVPPPSHPNRFRTCNAENGNFYRDHNSNEFVPHNNIGECWRPPFPAVSGPCYPVGPSMVHAPIYNGPPRNPTLPNNRWNFPPRPMNHRHVNPYRPPNGPIPVGNRGPNFWRPR